MRHQPAVKIEKLSRRFGDLEAVRELTLEIRPGETFGLLGPNGAGKTTTIGMLSTLLPPSSGDAQIFGSSLSSETRSVRRLVGLTPQEISLYPDLDAEENLRFFGRLHGVRGRELTERCGRLLELVGLETRRHDRVAAYSGGMKRRLNLACSLIHDPRLLLLDEPTVGVDPQSRERIFEAIREIAANGTTVIYTTHYMEEAERLCDRIAIMDEGLVAAVGTLDQLLEIVGMGEVIEIRCAEPLLRHSNLESIPQVVRVEANERVVRVFVKSAARALGPIGAFLVDEDCEVETLEVYSVNLERVFMHLTGKALRD
ncbi:MAG: ABC transporter ATP-binding protein [Myxococcota bacterium]|nr:ABC transporter ATP-binding protein [Myxococcota bacterium]